MHYLSIISPFYNSEKKCKRLLSTLLDVKDKGVEIIFVDDGSSDNTVFLLNNFKTKSQVDVKVVTQENKGPGGARNAGLEIARGNYVWFVDSDDDIKIEAIRLLKDIYLDGYDFIDFNYMTNNTNANSMDVVSGSYINRDENRRLLLNNFGRIWTKIINKSFIINNSIYYPEYCIYEDNPLSMIYPLLVKSFFKTDIIGYIHHEEYQSVTRSKSNPRLYDRLYTATYGLKESLKLTSNKNEIDLIERRFINLYLVNTVRALISITPSKKWIVTYRVMKRYRTEAKKVNIKKSANELFKEENTKIKIYLFFHWYVSFLLYNDQTSFFEKQRLKAWGRPFNSTNKVN